MKIGPATPVATAPPCKADDRSRRPQPYDQAAQRAARDEAAFRAALRWALQLDGPSVIDAFIDVEPYSTTVFD